METKKELRTRMIRMRKQMSHNDFFNKSADICSKIKSHPKFRQAKVIYCYDNIKNEVSLYNLQKEILKDKKILALPRIDEGVMNFYIIEDFDDLACGYMGIFEPKEQCREAPAPDIVLVPGVAFTKDGFRLGYGGGFYDRFLSHADTYSIGVAYDFQIVQTLPVEEHDICLDEIITND